MSKFNKFFLRLSSQDKILLAKRLAILVKAGVPILESLEMIKSQATSRAMVYITSCLIKDVENGQFLSTALGKFKNIFGEFTINIIRVGETSGTLYENLNYLAEELKKKNALKKKVVGALVYPIFIIIATLGIAGVLTIYVFPKILPIFKSFKFQLPWTTRLLIFISDNFLNHGGLIFSGIVVLIIGLWLLLRIKAIRYRFDLIILKVPLLGNIIQGYNMANFSRTLGLLLKSEVAIVEATNITADTTANAAYRKELRAIAENIRKGGKISKYMKVRTKLFPPILLQMVIVGETAGNLSDTLLYLAELYENEVDETSKNLSTVLEPLLMVFMGIIVGFVAVSIITPIYEITQNLHP